MAARKTLEVVIVGDTAKYTSAVNKAVTSTAKLTTAQSDITRSATRMGAVAGQSATKAASATTALGGSLNYVKSLAGQAGAAFVGFIGAQAVIAGTTRLFSALATAVLDFDTNMRNVNSLLGQNEAGFRRMGDAVLNLSKELPQTAGELSAGLYDVVSSGFQGADALSVLRASATAASAGLTDTATSGRAIAGVLNAYGLSAAHAQEVSDVLFQTVNLGVISFEELANTVGDFVGTAAALGVPIEDAASALATMTLSGISAEESSTALNRVMLAMISPSTAMAALFKSWGFESGTAAVKALGLRGVMERIRLETGGTADSMAGLFVETRGLKGALALLSDDGKNYGRVTREMKDANEGAGASAKVLAEQAKSLGFQLTIAKNNIMAVGIEAGRWLGPRIAQGLSILSDVAGDVAAGLQKLWQGAQPGLEALADVFADLVAIGGDLFNAVKPLATVFAQIAGASIVVLFNTLARAVSTATGFLRDHSEIVVALAAIYGVRLVSSISLAAQAFGVLASQQVASTLLAARTAAAQLALSFSAIAFQARQMGVVTAVVDTIKGGLSGLGGALSGPGGMVAGLVAVGIVAKATGDATSKAMADAKKETDKLLDSVDTTRFSGITKASEVLRGRLEEVSGAADQGSSTWGKFVRTFQDVNPAMRNAGTEAVETANATIAALERMGAKRAALEINLRSVAKGTGLKGFFEPIIDEIDRTGRIVDSKLTPQAKKFEAFARSIGEDLTVGGEKGANAATRVAEKLVLLGTAAGYSKEQLAQGLFDEKTLEEEGKAAQEFANTVLESFSAAGDVIAALGNEEELSGAKIEEFYANAIASTSTFLANIEEAYRQGFDKGLVARLLAAGPEAAGPLLQAMVDQNSDAFVQTVNDAESELRRLSVAAVEIARLQATAVKAESDTIAAMLPDAIQIGAEKARQGAAATTQTIADALHLTPSQVTEISAAYGIEIPGPKAVASVDTLVAQTDLKELEAAVLAVPTLITTEPNVNDPDDVKTWWDDLRAKLLLIPGLRDTVAQITDPQQAWAWWSELKTRIDLVPGDKETIARVTDHATPILEFLTHYHIPDKEFAVTARRQMAGSFGGNDSIALPGFDLARGGIVRFAGGAERHVAQIARPGDMRLWAEPETGGEAYIPLAPSKRARSARILMAVADQFGMARYADGGQWGPMTKSTGEGDIYITVDARGSDNPAATRTASEAGAAAALERVTIGRRMRRL